MRCLPLLLLLVLASCQPEETALQLRMPDVPQTLWRYEVEKLADDTTLIGILDVQNQTLGTHDGRSNVLIQERQLMLDSLQNTPQRVQRSEAYFINRGSVIEQWTDSPFDVFDRMFRPEIFDTLSARTDGGPDFQTFDAFKPGWLAPYRFKATARYSYDVLPGRRFFVKFRHDRDTLAGHVDVSAFAIFSGLEKISVPFDTATVAYRMKTTLEMDFSLTVNRTRPLSTYRKTTVLYTWFHPEYGIVRRTREPFTLAIPAYQTRNPLIRFPGERWSLILYIEGVEAAS